MNILPSLPEVCKLDLHPLVDDLSDRYQVLRDFRTVLHVNEFPFLPDMTQGNFTGIRNRMRSVVSGCDYSRLHRFLKI